MMTDNMDVNFTGSDFIVNIIRHTHYRHDLSEYCLYFSLN